MIVKMSGLEQDYQKFFDEFVEDFKDKDFKEINDLTTFYSALSLVKQELADRQYWKYLRIPLGEEHFQINADTRSIQIPDHFSKYGLGVEGDHTAEVIFFEIDRYFDTMDLAACLGTMDSPAPEGSGCFIQWKNALGHEGVSRAYAFDICDETIDPDTGLVLEDAKLIFGWVISNKITEGAGNIEFSVRFVQTEVEDDENSFNPIINIMYSFSTLSAKCAVKPSLRLDLENLPQDSIEDLSELLLSRPVYSGIANSTEGSKPVIVVDLSDGGDLTEKDGDVSFLILSVEAIPAREGDTLKFIWYQDGKAVTEEIDGELNEAGNYVTTHRVESAGHYYVYVANTHMSPAGIPLQRWLQSNTFVVTLPKPIRAKGFASYLLSDEGATVSVIADTEDTNSVIAYNWTVTDYVNNETTSFSREKTNADEDYKTDIYEVEEGFNGEVTVEVTNTLNNSTTKDAVLSPCLIRSSLAGKKPFTVEIVEDNGVLRAVVDAPDHYYTENELIYDWYCDSEGQLTHNVDDRVFGQSSYIPIKSDGYRVAVIQVLPLDYGTQATDRIFSQTLEVIVENAEG